MIEHLDIGPYKQHQLGPYEQVSQWGFEGIALSPKEQALFLKLNELISHCHYLEDRIEKIEYRIGN